MAVYVIAEYCHVHFITPLIHQAWYFKEKNYAAIASMHTVLVIALAPKMFRYLFKFPSYCVLLSKSCLALYKTENSDLPEFSQAVLSWIEVQSSWNWQCYLLLAPTRVLFQYLCKVHLTVIWNKEVIPSWDVHTDRLADCTKWYVADLLLLNLLRARPAVTPRGLEGSQPHPHVVQKECFVKRNRQFSNSVSCEYQCFIFLGGEHPTTKWENIKHRPHWYSVGPQPTPF